MRFFNNNRAGQQAHRKYENSNEVVPDQTGGQWSVVAPVLKFRRTELLFCKRFVEGESEFAIIERLDPNSPLAQAKGVWQLQMTSNDPRLLLQDFMEGERQTLQLYAQDIVAMSREAVEENFPDRDLGRVVKAISQRCSKKSRWKNKLSPFRRENVPKACASKEDAMPDFNTLFPNFTSRCVELQGILSPIAYLLVVGGMISATITGHRSGAAYMRTFGRTIVFIVLMTFLVSWGNQISSVVDSTVKNVLKVDPTKVYDDYQKALQMQKAAEGEKSWWEKVFEWRASLMEAILTGIFFFFGWIAGALVWWAYLLQTVILFIGYGLSPIFIGFLAFQSLHEVGKRYFLNLVGVMIWPLGWGVAGLVTQSMIDFMTDRSFLHAFPVVGSDAYSLQNLMGVAFLAIWLIFSTIAAPLIIQKAIASGSSAASHLLSGAFAAGRTAAAAGATTLANVGTGVTGVGGAITAGVTSAATAFESLGAASINLGYGGGSLVGSLSEMQGLSRRRRSHPISFPADDPTGDRTVAALIRKTRNPYSSQG